MRGTVQATAVVLCAALFAGCGSDSSTTVQSTTYVSTMNGANEVPQRATTATGTATYVLTGNLLTFTVNVTGLTTPATLSHIHVGASTVAGPIVVPFTLINTTTASGTITSGVIDLSQPIVNGTSSITGDSLKVLLNNGNAYTNVHTATFPAGEIRGQIVRQ